MYYPPPPTHTQTLFFHLILTNFLFQVVYRYICKRDICIIYRPTLYCFSLRDKLLHCEICVLVSFVSFSAVFVFVNKSCKKKIINIRLHHIAKTLPLERFSFRIANCKSSSTLGKVILKILFKKIVLTLSKPCKT